MLAFINSTNDLIVIAIVVLLFFGANRIPEVMRGLGKGMRELKKGMSDEDPQDTGRMHSPKARLETGPRE